MKIEIYKMVKQWEGDNRRRWSMQYKTVKVIDNNNN